MYFSKKVYAVHNRVRGKAPRNRGVFKIFCVKNNLTVYKVTFNCKLQKKIGEQDALAAPPIILLWEQLNIWSCSHGSRTYTKRLSRICHIMKINRMIQKYHFVTCLWDNPCTFFFSKEVGSAPI